MQRPRLAWARGRAGLRLLSIQPQRMGRGRRCGWGVQQPLAGGSPAELLVLPDCPQEPWLWALSLPHQCVLLLT